MYKHAPENYICPFCSLIQGTDSEHTLSVQGDIVHRTPLVTAFIGSHQWPNNPGNVIVVPNEHFENIYELPVHFALPMHELVKAVALAMKAVYACSGVSTRQHNEPAGNQDVWHYHVHVTPRYRDDRFYASQRALMPPDERAKNAQRLGAYLKARL
jgi:histidine triad (HIT) family protein